jgi:hypothetical protein
MSKYRTLRLKGGSKVALHVSKSHKLPEQEIVAAVRFALAGMNVDRMAVHVKNSGHGSNVGRAYYQIPGMASAEIPRWCRHLIVVKEGQLDGIVATTAHEGKHIEEWRDGRYHSNKKRRRTEVVARREELVKLKAWRARPRP